VTNVLLRLAQMQHSTGKSPSAGTVKQISPAGQQTGLADSCLFHTEVLVIQGACTQL